MKSSILVKKSSKLINFLASYEHLKFMTSQFRRYGGLPPPPPMVPEIGDYTLIAFSMTKGPLIPKNSVISPIECNL